MRAAACALLVCSVAHAQPEPRTELGALGPESSLTLPIFLGPREVAWFRFELPAISTTGRWLDIWTLAGSPPALSNADTIIALYSNDGQLVKVDDDDGPGDYSALSFGQASPPRPPVGGSLSFNGRDGQLAAGSYYFAVAAFRTDFALTDWGALPLMNVSGNVTLRLELGCSACPTNPSCTASIEPAHAPRGQSLLITVTPAAGANPPSTALAAEIDLSPLGGPAVVPLRDDGLAGDRFAADGVHSLEFILPAGAPDGTHVLNARVVDAQRRAGACAMTLSVATPAEWFEEFHGGADAEQTPAQHQRILGDGPVEVIWGSTTEFDADVYMLRVADPSSFSATVESITPGTDPQAFLFEACGGLGVVCNNDAVGESGDRARLGPGHIPRAGVYLLGVSGEGVDPFDDFGAPLWAIRPPRSELPPDNARPLWWWFGQSVPMSYRVTLSGCERVTPDLNACACPADFNGSGAVDPDDLGDFLNCYFATAPCPGADFDGSGTRDPDDLGDFINAYFGHFQGGGGCP
ncbi:MAG: hypothetical protein AB7K52_02350 [Phycisphaerales bacterium]